MRADHEAKDARLEAKEAIDAASALRYQDRFVELLQVVENKPGVPPLAKTLKDDAHELAETLKDDVHELAEVRQHARAVKQGMQERIERLASLLMHERAARREAQEALARAAAQVDGLFRAHEKRGGGGEEARDALVRDLHSEASGLRDAALLLASDNAELAHEREGLRRRAANHAE
ncbi:hypothetical protein T484DRAFT_1900770, partial [Baffinella frigidus]